MRVPIVLGAVALLTACTASPPATSGAAEKISTADSSAIAGVTSRLAAAGRSANWDAWGAEYTAEPVRFPPNIPALVGKVASDAFNKASPKFTMFDATVTTVEGRGDMAVATGTYKYSIPAGKDAAGKATPAVNDEGKFMQVLVKQPGGSWKIERDIWNSNLPVTPAPAAKK